MLGQDKRPGGASCPVTPHEDINTGRGVPREGSRPPGQQRASVGHGKANAIVTPIKLRVELANEAGA